MIPILFGLDVNPRFTPHVKTLGEVLEEAKKDNLDIHYNFPDSYGLNPKELPNDTPILVEDRNLYQTAWYDVYPLSPLGEDMNERIEEGALYELDNALKEAYRSGTCPKELTEESVEAWVGNYLKEDMKNKFLTHDYDYRNPQDIVRSYI